MGSTGTRGATTTARRPKYVCDQTYIRSAGRACTTAGWRATRRDTRSACSTARTPTQGRATPTPTSAACALRSAATLTLGPTAQPHQQHVLSGGRLTTTAQHTRSHRRLPRTLGSPPASTCRPGLGPGRAVAAAMVRGPRSRPAPEPDRPGLGVLRRSRRRRDPGCRGGVPPTAQELARGEGLIGRTLGIRVDAVLWSANGVAGRLRRSSTGRRSAGSSPTETSPTGSRWPPRTRRASNSATGTCWRSPGRSSAARTVTSSRRTGTGWAPTRSSPTTAR